LGGAPGTGSLGGAPGETIGARTAFGTFLVLVSVIVIATTPAKKAEIKAFVEELGETS